MMIEFELSPWMCFSMAKYCVRLKSLQKSMAAAVFFLSSGLPYIMLATCFDGLIFLQSYFDRLFFLTSSVAVLGVEPMALPIQSHPSNSSTIIFSGDVSYISTVQDKSR